MSGGEGDMAAPDLHAAPDIHSASSSALIGLEYLRCIPEHLDPEIDVEAGWRRVGLRKLTQRGHRGASGRGTCGLVLHVAVRRSTHHHADDFLGDRLDSDVLSARERWRRR